MPTINVEMMQQLLHEFTDKEALTGEEIKVIEQQVHELEERIIVCRERLQSLNQDKDRLAAMMSRYVGGKTTPIANVESKGSTGRFKSVPKISDNKAVPSVGEPKPDKTDVEIAAETPGQDSVIEDLEPAAESEQDSDNLTNKPGNDDAIKSINDALKGLFRK